MPRNPREYRDFLMAGRWFGALPEAFREGLLAAATLRTLPAEGRLFSRGDVPDGVYAVLDGGLRISAVGERGREAVLAVVEPPQWFGEIAVFDRLPRTHDAVAAVDSMVLHVSAPALDALLSREPTWWRDLGLLVTSKLRLAFVTLEDTALQPLVPRLARRLVMMADGYGEFTDRSRRVLKASQELLAAMVASSRQSTNQALKELESRGLIRLAYGELEIRDLPGLRRVAHGE